MDFLFPMLSNLVSLGPFLQNQVRFFRNFDNEGTLPNFDLECLVHGKGRGCTVPKYHAALDYTLRLRAPRNLPRCTANSDTYRQ